MPKPLLRVRQQPVPTRLLGGQDILLLLRRQRRLQERWLRRRAHQAPQVLTPLLRVRQEAVSPRLPWGQDILLLLLLL